jgi:hypothetical protein
LLSADARHFLRTNNSLPATATLRIVEPSGQIQTSRQQVVIVVSGLG